MQKKRIFLHLLLHKMIAVVYEVFMNPSPKKVLVANRQHLSAISKMKLSSSILVCPSISMAFFFRFGHGLRRVRAH